MVRESRGLLMRTPTETVVSPTPADDLLSFACTVCITTLGAATKTTG